MTRSSCSLPNLKNYTESLKNYTESLKNSTQESKKLHTMNRKNICLQSTVCDVGEPTRLFPGYRNIKLSSFDNAGHSHRRFMAKRGVIWWKQACFSLTQGKGRRKRPFRIAQGSKAPTDGTESLHYVSTTFAKYTKTLCPSRSCWEDDKCWKLLFFVERWPNLVFLRGLA